MISTLNQPLENLSRAEDLPNDVSVLRGMVRQLADWLGQARTRMDQLEKQLDQLLRRVYGRRSEQWNPDQKLMEELLATVLAQGPGPAGGETPSPTVKVESHTRQVTPHGRGLFPESIKKEEVILPVPEEERRCPVTGRERPVIGYEISRKLDDRPAELVVKVYKREKRGSVAGAEEVGVVTAPVVSGPVAKGLLDNGLLAHLVVSKFVDHLPLYRLEKMFERSGVDVSRRTMSDNLLEAAEPLSRLVEGLKKKILANGVVHHDDTPVDLLLEGQGSGRNVKQARLWAMTVPPKEGPWTIFQFSVSREARHVEEVFEGYHGWIVCDAYAGYLGLESAEIHLSGCWAHARRYFFEALKSSPKEASEILERIGRLYQIERQVDPHSEKDPERLRVRQQEAVPQLKELRSRLEEWNPRTPPKSPLGQAIGYALGNWERLVRYTQDGRLPIDNNPAEQVIRPIALGRRNWLFMGSERGGHAAAVYMSLVATCKRAGVNPWEYFRDVFGRIMDHSTHKLDELLPGIWKPLGADSS
jgi:transposase